MDNKQDTKKTDSVKPGPKYYLTRPDTPAAIKVASIRPQADTRYSIVSPESE